MRVREASSNMRRHRRWEAKTSSGRGAAACWSEGICDELTQRAQCLLCRTVQPRTTICLIPERQFAVFAVFFLVFFFLFLAELVLQGFSCLVFFCFFSAEVEGSLWIFNGWARPQTWHSCVSGKTKEAAAAAFCPGVSPPHKHPPEPPA